MKALIAILSGFISALFVTGIEEATFGQSSGWLALHLRLGRCHHPARDADAAAGALT